MCPHRAEGAQGLQGEGTAAGAGGDPPSSTRASGSELSSRTGPPFPPLLDKPRREPQGGGKPDLLDSRCALPDVQVGAGPCGAPGRALPSLPGESTVGAAAGAQGSPGRWARGAQGCAGQGAQGARGRAGLPLARALGRGDRSARHRSHQMWECVHDEADPRGTHFQCRFDISALSDKLGRLARFLVNGSTSSGSRIPCSELTSQLSPMGKNRRPRL